jgi:hypothetical protein
VLRIRNLLHNVVLLYGVLVLGTSSNPADSGFWDILFPLLANLASLISTITLQPATGELIADTQRQNRRIAPLISSI